MIAVIDYGGGNLGSLVAALERDGVAYVVTDQPSSVREAAASILPGDGAFAATMRALQERGLDDAILGAVKAGRPFLGICVGMQILFESSTEFGGAGGLGIFCGEVCALAGAPRLPHMGWNSLERVGSHPLTDGVEEGEHVYFLHSYAAPVTMETVCASTYGERFSAIVAREHVMGTQFHPEKSQRTGLHLLRNFARFVKEA